MKIEEIIPSCNLDTVKDGRGGIFTFIPKDPIVVSTIHVPVMSATSIESSAWVVVVVEVDVVTVGLGSVGDSELLWAAAISSASATHSSNMVSSAKHSSSH